MSPYYHEHVIIGKQFTAETLKRVLLGFCFVLFLLFLRGWKQQSLFCSIKPRIIMLQICHDGHTHVHTQQTLDTKLKWLYIDMTLAGTIAVHTDTDNS